jgi:hypothetical protein
MIILSPGVLSNGRPQVGTIVIAFEEQENGLRGGEHVAWVLAE